VRIGDRESSESVNIYSKGKNTKQLGETAYLGYVNYLVRFARWFDVFIAMRSSA